jgi:HSP20 family protein
MTKQFLPDFFRQSSGFPDVFTSLQREIDHVFRDFGRGWPMAGNGRANMMPVRFNLAETDQGFEVTADMPGIDAKDIDVQMRDGVLSIRGERKEEKDDKQKNYHLVERSYGSFERAFALPADVLPDKIEAKFDKGVLRVTLPKAPVAKEDVKKIEVKAAA